MKVDGGETITILSNYVLPSPIAPGDSVLATVYDYEFQPLSFAGGGITHDIIVWPMSAGVMQSDSAEKDVSYEFTQKNLSQHIGALEPLEIPGNINDGQAYDLRVSVINEDPVRNLVFPVTIYMTVDGDSPTILASDVAPEAPLGPGEIFQIDVDNYIFDAARFSGGGITHDIIVWPMAASIQKTDSAKANITYITAALESTIESATSSFTAQTNTGTSTIAITWETTAEVSGISFDVEKRQEDGSYKSIFIIEGSGSGEQGAFYKVEDVDPISGENNYRLNLHLADGEQIFLNETNANWEDPYGASPSVQVINNPFIDQLNLTFTIPYSWRKQVINGQFEIYNLSGQPVYKEEEILTSGKFEKYIDFTRQPEGIYFYRIMIGDKVLRGKLMKE